MCICKNAPFAGLWFSEFVQLCSIIFQYGFWTHLDLCVICLGIVRVLEQASDENLQEKIIFRAPLCFPYFNSNLPLLSIQVLAFARLHMESLLQLRQPETPSNLGFCQSMVVSEGSLVLFDVRLKKIVCELIQTCSSIFHLRSELQSNHLM